MMKENPPKQGAVERFVKNAGAWSGAGDIARSGEVYGAAAETGDDLNRTVLSSASGAVASFPDGSALPARDVTVQIVPYQSGTGDPSPENIRPISGWTGANVARSAENIFDTITLPERTYKGLTYAYDPNDSSYKITGICTEAFSTTLLCGFTGNAIHANLEAGKSYTFICSSNFSELKTIKMEAYYSNGSVLIENGATFTLAEDSNSQVIRGYDARGNYITYTAGRSYGIKLQFAISSKADTYPVTWQTEAGTVYGGTLDVTTGKLTAEYRLVTFDGTEAWGIVGNDSYFYTVVGPVNSCVSGVGVSSHFRLAGITSTNNAIGFYVYNRQSSSYMATVIIRMYENKQQTLEQFKTYLAEQYAAETPVQVAYKLAPDYCTEYQLTPTEIDLFLGENNVWADTGDTAVEYYADTKKYIDKLTTPAEDDMTAQENITYASYFMVGKRLFIATDDIAEGDALVTGTNCTETNIAEVMNSHADSQNET